MGCKVDSSASKSSLKRASTKACAAGAVELINLRCEAEILFSLGSPTVYLQWAPLWNRPGHLEMQESNHLAARNIGAVGRRTSHLDSVRIAHPSDGIYSRNVSFADWRLPAWSAKRNFRHVSEDLGKTAYDLAGGPGVGTLRHCLLARLAKAGCLALNIWRILHVEWRILHSESRGAHLI